MALVKTVEMRVLANAGDAQAKLDELDAKAKDLDGNAIRMRFRVDSAEGKAQLDAIKARADELGFKDVTIKVKVDGKGRAIADLEAIKHEADSAGGGGGILGRLGGLGGSGGGASLSGGIPLLGGVGPAAIAALIPAAAALLVEVTGVVSGFAAAGAGAAAFALLAEPAIKRVETALTDIQKGKSLSALHLTVDEKGAVAGIEKLRAEFGKISTAFQPQAFKVFNDGLRVANSLLPHVAPFANTFAQGLDKLLQQAAKFTQSKGFADWVKQFHSLEGPAIASIGHGIGEVANAFGKLMTVMSGKDVAHAINIAFGAISGTIGAVTAVVHGAMQAWDGWSNIARRNAHDIASSFDSIRHAAASVGGAVAGAFDIARHAVATFVSSTAHGVAEVVGFFGTLPAKIVGALGNLGGILVAAGRSVIMGFLHGLESAWGAVTSFVSGIAGWIASHKGPLDADAILLVPHGQAIMSGLMRGMDSQMPALRRQLAGVSSTINASVSSGAHGYGSGGVHITVNGAVDAQGTARQIQQLLVQYKRTGGGAPLGIA